MRKNYTTFEVFSELDGQFLRYRANIAGNSADLLFFSSDGRVFENTVDKATFRDMLLEQSVPAITEAGSGTCDDTERSSSAGPVSFPLPALQILTLLGACDAVLQGRYEEGWFTASSLLNTYDLSDDSDYSRVCAPVAAVASEIVYRILDKSSVEKALGELLNVEILSDDLLDQTALYRFTPDYVWLPMLFAEPARRLALIGADQDGSFVLLYLLSGRAGTWLFSMGSDEPDAPDAPGENFVEQIEESHLHDLFSQLLRISQAAPPPGSAPGPALDNARKANFCTSCGASLPEGSKFCSSCGTPV